MSGALDLPLHHRVAQWGKTQEHVGWLWMGMGHDYLDGG